MTWRKFFKTTDASPLTNAGHSLHSAELKFANWASRLPEVYIGHPNRIERYTQYENMDSDSEINASLDILGEYCTQINIENGTAFDLHFWDTATDSEIKNLKKELVAWWKVNEFERRIFKIFRNALKYGDQVFIRDPETLELFWINMEDVIKVIVNEGEGKEPEQYIIKDVNPNFESLTLTQVTHQDAQTGSTSTGANHAASYMQLSSGYTGAGGSRFEKALGESAIGAEHIVHVSLTEGMDAAWPFGNSILERIFKIYKQKELLEDAILIYRIQRAPERRIFKIDVGGMPSHMAMAFVERVKNEIHQKRLPSQTGGGVNMMDATYNPLSTNEDYFFPQMADGRGSSVETLPGGCLSMDTKVSLLDGRDLSIADIEQEMNDGKELWTYSCHPTTGAIAPGLISWAGVTNKSAKVLKITLDNGEEIIATPDHKFPIYNKGFVEANDLNINDSLIPLYKKSEFINKHKKLDYEKVFDNEHKEWKYTHRLVSNTLHGKYVFENTHEIDSYPKNVTHHIDHNRHNNTPSNLCMMSWDDHKKYHQDNGFSKENQEKGSKAAKEKLEWMKINDPELYKEHCDVIREKSKMFWKNLTDKEYHFHVSKQRDGIEKYIENQSHEEREIRAENSRKSFLKGSKQLQENLKDPEYNAWFRQQQSNGWTEESKNRQSKKTAERNNLRWKEHGDELRKQHKEIQEINYDISHLNFVISCVKGKTTHQVTINDVVKTLNNNGEMVSVLQTLNKHKKVPNWNNDKFSVSMVKKMVKDYGFNNWSDFRRKHSLFNHKIVKIEYLNDEIEVGTLTIDSDEIVHDYHTFALSSGVFTKNSNLGEIDDLLYFNNKMLRGLRIPSSYLPTGPDDGTASYNDGRLGTAMQQEKAFNDFCQRLQRYIAPTFDREFKMFLSMRGFEIDNSLFDLRMNPPQNFASYRQVEVDSNRIQTYASVKEDPFLARRFILKRFMGLTEEELQENDQMWEEENGTPKTLTPSQDAMRGGGFSPGGFESDGELAEPDNADFEAEMSDDDPADEGAEPDLEL